MAARNYPALKTDGKGFTRTDSNNYDIDAVTCHVSGTTFTKRQNWLSWLKKLIRLDKSRVKVTLVRERDNSYDANAIKVLARDLKTGKVANVGYIPRELAAHLAPYMDNTHKWVNIANWDIIGRNTRGCNLGMTLNLNWKTCWA